MGRCSGLSATLSRIASRLVRPHTGVPSASRSPRASESPMRTPGEGAGADRHGDALHPRKLHGALFQYAAHHADQHLGMAALEGLEA
jgi:hypothetical protein